MDMRAEHTLGYSNAETQENDRAQIKFIVFGGILGDHPPQDRAKEFREQNFKKIRNLSTVQMTTDTALLVSYEIMQQNKQYQDLKFVDNPEVPLEQEVVPFLDSVLDIEKLAAG